MQLSQALLVVANQCLILSPTHLGSACEMCSISSPAQACPSQVLIQAVANDPDNSEDRLGEPLPFLYAWSAIAPSATSLAYPQSQQLFTAAALQAGAVSFAAGELSVSTSPLCIMHTSRDICACMKLKCPFHIFPLNNREAMEVLDETITSTSDWLHSSSQTLLIAI